MSTLFDTIPADRVIPVRAGPGTAVGPPAAAVPTALDAIGRTAFATWDGVVSLGQTHRMSEADKAYWREKWRPAFEDGT